MNANGTATFKAGYGFHPMFCFADQTSETLARLLRAGNTGANTVAGRVVVLDRAVAQLPGEIAPGHRAGDDQELVTRQLVGGPTGPAAPRGSSLDTLQ